MLKYTWNEDKNTLLKQTRNISFQEIVKKLKSKDVLANLPHHNQDKYPKQRQFIIKINNYIYVIPYIKDNQEIFLKTIYPNRKLNKKYTGGTNDQN